MEKVLLKLYTEAASEDVKCSDTTEPKEFFKFSTIEYLIACNEIINGSMNEDTKEVFIEQCHKSNNSRLASGAYSINSCIYANYEDIGIARGNSVGDIWSQQPFGTIYTHAGQNIPEVYKRSPELTAHERVAINSEYDALYPQDTRVYAATVNYNCHSYACYYASPYNQYWIGLYYPCSIYIDDGSYTQYTGIPYAGVKAYYDGEHSGIYTGSASGDGIEYIVRSKWGMCGVYEHSETYCPYTSSISRYVLSD